jgi:radical SAM protein with 4Fe4S-binding SPASM domain
VDRAWIPKIDRRKCTACAYSAICEAICPAGAIELPYLIRWAEDESGPHGDR